MMRDSSSHQKGVGRLLSIRPTLRCEVAPLSTPAEDEQ